MKITVIGGGSTYTPELITGFHYMRDFLQVDDLTLMDTDRERLDNVGAFAQRIVRHHQLPMNVSLTTDLSEAITEADAVLIQIRVGGQAMRLQDEVIPLKYGQIGQETTGAGGAMKALRTVPKVLEIAEHTKRLAKKDAWIIDFTNPVGIVTRALRDNGYKAVGLCNYAIGMQRWAAQLLGVDAARVEVDPVGLNHFSWTRSIRLDGEEKLPHILAQHQNAVTEKVGFPPKLTELLGAIPSYYLQWYYANQQRLQQLQNEKPRAQAVAEIEEQLLKMYKDTNLVQRPPLLEQRGGAYYSEAAAELLASLLGSRPGRHVINVQNEGMFCGLADDDIIETLCEVNGSVKAVNQAPMPPVVQGPVQHVLAYERLICEAAQTGSRDTLKLAFLAHPLLGEYDYLDGLLDELLQASRQYLPLFV